MKCLSFTAFLIFLTLFVSIATKAEDFTRLTSNTGPDLGPAWDPRGVTIVYSRLKAGTSSVYDAYKVESSNQAGEQAYLTGLNADFGVAVGLSWIGTTGFLAVEEAISGFEDLKFDTSMAPFDRTITNGSDAATTLLLSINGGGGGGLLKISRDGNVALTRFGTSGSGGNVSIRSGLLSTMTGQVASAFGTVLLSANVGSDPRFYFGGSLSPDGSKYVLPIPVSTSTTGHDLFISDTSPSATSVNLTNNASSGVFNVYPEFSPDGTKIAFARWSGVSGETYDLYMMNVDGTGLTQLTNTPNFTEIQPSWSPDGGSIAFTGTHLAGHETEFPALESGESANANIYILRLPALNIVTPKTQLTEPPTITIDGTNVTFTFASFAQAQLSTKANSTSKVLLERTLRKASSKVPFRYHLEIKKQDGKKRDNISKNSKKNSLTISNMKPGTYTAKYRVELTPKGKAVKRTKFSPSATFTIQ